MPPGTDLNWPFPKPPSRVDDLPKSVPDFQTLCLLVGYLAPSTQGNLSRVKSVKLGSCLNELAV